MRRRVTFVLLSIVICLGLALPASAFTITGGTQEQRDIIREAILAAEVPTEAWTDHRYFGGVNIEIVEHFDPLWYDPVSFDVLQGALGAAWPGQIRIMAAMNADRYLAEVTTHEWAHQVWFALPVDANREWQQMATEGKNYDPNVWLENPVENHGEHLSWAGWPAGVYRVTATPRTRLNTFDRNFVRQWHENWINPTTTTTTSPPPPPTTTTTTVRGDPFPDVSRDDSELWEAAWWASDAGFIFGFHDGTFGPYLPLTHRQLATIVDRWIGLSLTGYMSDWSPVTRAETRAALPNLTWNEDRGTEPLTRSQLVRLMWRAR